MDYPSNRKNADHIGGSSYSYVRDESIRGAGVGALTILLRAIVDVASIVVLARLLTPADFGVVAMASTVLNLLRIVGDWGLVMAATQQWRINDHQLSALFWINVVGGISLAGLAMVCAPLLVLVYDEPRITAATVVLSVTLVAIGLGAQHEAILRRQLNYGKLHVLDVVSQGVGLVVGVTLALVGMGYWSLILLQVVARSVRTSWLWIATQWVPGRPRRKTGIREILKYGNQFVPIQILAHGARSFGDTIVGVAAGASDLGVYRKAHGVVLMAEQLKVPLKAMMPASLSRLQDRPEEFSRFYIQAVAMWAMVACGAIGYVTSEATLVVRVLLGDQWLGVVPMIGLLAPAGVAAALGASTEWMLLPLADMRRLLWLRTLRGSCIAIGVLIGWRWGVRGIAAGYSISTCASLVVELVFVTKGRRVIFRNLLGIFLRSLVAAVVASASTFIVPDNVPFVLHAADLILYLAVYAAIHLILPGGREVLLKFTRAIYIMVNRGPLNE